MTFYLEVEAGGEHRPYVYRLCARGPGPFHGDYGILTDADLAALIVDLLNAKMKGGKP